MKKRGKTAGLRNTHVSLLLLGLSTCAALTSTLTLPQAYYPVSPRPFFTVHSTYPSGSARTIDREITAPLAEEIQSLPTVVSTSSVSDSGTSNIYVEGSIEAPRTQIGLQIRESLRAVSDRLPSNMLGPFLYEGGEKHVPIWVGTFPVTHRDEAKRFSEEAKKISPKLRVEGPPPPQSELILNYNGPAASSSGAGVSPVLSRTERLFHRSYYEGRNLRIRFSPDENLPLVTTRLNTDLLPISHFSEFSFEENDSETFQRFNGAPALFVSVYNESGDETVHFCRRLEDTISSYPHGHSLFDRGRAIGDIIREVFISIGIGMILVFVLLLRRASPSETVPLFISIPLALTGAGVSLHLTSVSLNMMTLAGIALGIGLCVDTSVIAYEVIRNRGLTAFRRHTAVPLLIASATTVVVFLPLLFFPQRLSSHFAGLAAVVIPIIAVSTVYTLIILPHLIEERGKPFHRTLSTHRSFRRILTFSGPSRFHLSLSLLVLILASAIGLLLFSLLRYESFPPLPDRSLRLRYEFPPGTVREAVDTALRPLEAELLPLTDELRVSARSEEGRVTLTPSAHHSSAEIERYVRNLHQSVAYGGELFFEAGNESDEKSEGVTLFFSAGNYSEARAEALNASRTILNRYPRARVIYHFKDSIRGYRIELKGNRLPDFSPPLRTAGELFWLLADVPFEKAVYEKGEYDVDIKTLYSPLNDDRPALPRIISSTTPPSTGAVIEEYRSYSRISRRQGEASAGLTVEIKGIPLGELYTQLSELFPQAAVGEELEEKRRFKMEIFFFLLSAVAMIAILLYIHFGSFRSTVATLLQIPFSYILPLVLLFLLDVPLTIPGLTGFLLLAGLSVNNGIVLFGGDEMRRGNCRRASEEEEGNESPVDRFVEKESALFLSTATTAAGIIPILFTGLSSGVLAPLSLVVASGTLASFFLLYIETGIVLGRFDTSRSNA